MTNKSANRLKEGANALFSMSDELPSETATETPPIANSESGLVSSEQEVARQNTEINSKETRVASNVSERASSESSIATQDPVIASNESGLTSREDEVVTQNTEIASKESRIASNVLERASSESSIATHKPGIVSSNGIDAEKLDAAMKSYFEDPRVTLYADVGGAILSYLHRTHAIDSISAEGAKAMEAELKRKNPEIWKAIQLKLKTEDKWKPILDKRGKRKRRT
jgi:hypothetical protein